MEFHGNYGGQWLKNESIPNKKKRKEKKVRNRTKTSFSNPQRVKMNQSCNSLQTMRQCSLCSPEPCAVKSLSTSAVSQAS